MDYFEYFDLVHFFVFRYIFDIISLKIGTKGGIFIKILRPCQHIGCLTLTLNTYCDLHINDKKEHRKNSNQRGYTYKWQKARESYLSHHPFCVECEKNGLKTLATDVDHIVPHRGDQKLFWDKSNWQPLCHSCHSKKTQKEDNEKWY